MVSLFSIIMIAFVIFSPAPPKNVRRKLGVYVAFRILKTGLQLQTFDITQSDALVKRQCIAVQGAWTLMEQVVPSFNFLHTRAENRTLLIDLIPTSKSGTLYFYSGNMFIDCSSVHTLSDGSPRTTAQLIS